MLNFSDRREIARHIVDEWTALSKKGLVKAINFSSRGVMQFLSSPEAHEKGLVTHMLDKMTKAGEAGRALGMKPKTDLTDHEAVKMIVGAARKLAGEVDPADTVGLSLETEDDRLAALIASKARHAG